MRLGTNTILYCLNSYQIKNGIGRNLRGIADTTGRHENFLWQQLVSVKGEHAAVDILLAAGSRDISVGHHAQTAWPTFTGKQMIHAIVTFSNSKFPGSKAQDY